MNESFAKLGLDYLDLVLIHSPGMPPGTVFQRTVLVDSSGSHYTTAKSVCAHAI